MLIPLFTWFDIDRCIMFVNCLGNAAPSSSRTSLLSNIYLCQQSCPKKTLIYQMPLLFDLLKIQFSDKLNVLFY